MAYTQCDFFLCNRIDPLGSGSDFASFVQQIGLPSVDLTYEYDKVKMFGKVCDTMVWYPALDPVFRKVVNPNQVLTLC